MPDTLSGTLVWVAALLAGGLLGGVFFGGLWWTVRRGALSPTPARWFLGSFALRTAIVLAGFYAVGAGQPLRLGLCLLGFLLARAIVLRATRPAAAVRGPPCA
ncbi:ATP synthase subunit I [Piscinibacter sp.]|uniref:ATP synthase subunit I n=1 Tax=Piscinibacter sp. TaxID=1903157 RepID=UPI002B6C2F98|nr:ATP synthase subunit I [Albitalea sp.]HUG24505.1 ATP synthase subunit I [Albitalea sp.]